MHRQVDSNHEVPPLSSPRLQDQPLAPEINHARACKHIREAAAQGCHLAVLPEYHLTGWVPDDPNFMTVCQESWHKCLDSYCELARELKMCIVPGTLVQKEAAAHDGDQGMQNMAYFIDDKGKVLGKYQKKNLWSALRQRQTCL